MTYIPRSSLLSNNVPGAIPKVLQKRRTIRVFSVLGGIIFTCSLVAAGGLYFYKGYAEKQLAEANAALLSNSLPDTESQIGELSKFDNRLNMAHSLLNNHIAPSLILEQFEKITKATVQLTTFKYTYDPGFEAFLEIGGVTNDLVSVAQQKITFVKDNMFTQSVMSDISVGSKDPEADAADANAVEFNVKGSIDQSTFAYSGAVEAAEQTFNPVTEDAALEENTATDASAVTE
jgi:hypothetical protein